MESVSVAARNIFRKLYATCANKVKRWSLGLLRGAIERADEWCHAQEVRLRQAPALAVSKAEVDPAASAARERAHRSGLTVSNHDLGGVSAGKSNIGNSASPHSRVLRPHRLPRLKYQHGQFVETR